MPSIITLSALTTAGILLAFAIKQLVYNVFIHPLRDFPGPIAHRASVLPSVLMLWSGRQHILLKNLHDRYGPVVRVGPNELSFIDPKAWSDMYGSRRLAELHQISTGYLTVLCANFEEESESALAPRQSVGFSERAVREQGNIIHGHVRALMDSLKLRYDGYAEKVDLARWFAIAAADAISDLVVGESFDGIRGGEVHPLPATVPTIVKQDMFMAGLRMLGLGWLASCTALVLCLWDKKRLELIKFCAFAPKERISYRAQKQRRPDTASAPQSLLTKNLQKKDDVYTSPQTAAKLIFVGTETTASALSGVIYYLGRNPHTLRKAKMEVRQAFQSENDIDLESVNELEYLGACIQEALRLYPPSPTVSKLVVPEGGGRVICGVSLPGNTIVSIPQWAINRSDAHWTDPLDFCPQRWLGDHTRYVTDKREAMQDFSLGPRDCLDQNLANPMLRLILAHIIYVFDIKLAEDSYGWTEDQRAWITYFEKRPLNVYLKQVHGMVPGSY